MIDDTQGYNLAAIRDLLLAAFTKADDLRQLFFFAENPRLQVVPQQFGADDSLRTMAERATAYCSYQGLVDDLLQEVRKANEYQYGLFEDRLRQPRRPGPATPDVEVRQFEPVHVDPDNPPIAAIRGLLLAAFTSKGLHDFCQDRPDFRPLLTRFGADLALDGMVADVIEYCNTQLLWDTLLVEVAQVSPAQYARFEPRLRQT